MKLYHLKNPMLDRFLYNVFGKLDDLCEWIANKLAGPRCECRKKKKKDA